MVSRQIKFRAWLSTAEEMLYNVVCPVESERMQNMHWMQFTGLYDKNGKEIFEGDIVRLASYVATVSRGAAMFIADWGADYCPLYVYDKSYEIIGNIFENQELPQDKND